MQNPISKKVARELLGFTVDARLADFFDISESAVSQWADDEPIPQLRQLQLRARRPDLFSDQAGAPDSKAV